MIKVGDRVVVVDLPEHYTNGRAGTVKHIGTVLGFHWVRLDGEWYEREYQEKRLRLADDGRVNPEAFETATGALR